jgi:hypothetical protein
MAKRLSNYIKYAESLLGETHTYEEWAKIRREMLVQIGFFQHERLIHLIVTVCFALLTMMGVILMMMDIGMFSAAMVCLLTVLLIPYIIHYYKLENGTQRLYDIYTEIADKEEMR